MTSDNKRNMSDDEYQFPHEEEFHSIRDTNELSGDASDAGEVAVQSSPADRMQEVLKNASLGQYIGQYKRVIIAVGLAVCAFVLFKVMRPSHETIHHTKPVAAPTQVAEPRPQMNVDLMNDLNNLKQNESASQNAINQLQSQVQDLKQELNQANTTQAELNQSISTLMDVVKRLSDQVKESKQHKTEAPKPVAPSIVYHIKAIVAGRAWIETEDGTTETVSVGDKVKQYGIVVSIDHDNGIIATSSGKVIRYGTTDT